jgi:hypothetical protein
MIQYVRSLNTPVAAFKADISKAFDMISWDFIIKNMEVRGFPTNWITWIKGAVLSGTSQIIVT